MMKLQSITAPRRQFFRLLFAETLGLAEEVRGKPQMRLNELDQVSDAIMGQMVPVFNLACSYIIDEYTVFRCHKSTNRVQEVYQLRPLEKRILDLFDGHHTVEAISVQIAEEFGVPPEQAYQQVKTLFIQLARFAICHPAQAHDEPGERR